MDEVGTEAAAATGIVMKRGGRPLNFAVNHPFIFLIRDRETGSVLFLGRVVDPA
ncbi:MAG: serpin family protein [Planctomycetota bacterium]